MNTPNSSAGVYLNEIDLSQRIDAAYSSVGVAVGEARKGPVGERTLITSNKQFLETFGIPEPKRFFAGYSALLFLKESNRLYFTRVAPNALTGGAHLTVDDPSANSPVLRLTNFDDGSNQPLGAVNPLDTIHYLPGDPANENKICFFCGKSPGLWNNRLYIRTRPSYPENHPEYNPNRFWVDVFLDYKGVGQMPEESFFVSQIQEKDAYGEQLHLEFVINNKSSLIRVKKNPYCPPVKISEDAYEFIDGASDGNPATLHDISAAWELYRDPDLVDINILMNCGYSDPIVQRKMDSICQSRMDCVSLIDVPSHLCETARAINYSVNTLNLNSSYSALYAPDVKIYDEHNDIDVWIPLSSFAANICAKIDTEGQPCFAPAGIEFGTIEVLDTRARYDQGARDALDEANVNVLRRIPGIGNVLWGQETSQSYASALSFLNVRRFLTVLEKRIKIASLYFVYRPNDVYLRDALKALIRDFVLIAKGAGCLYAFEIICDESNNTPDIIATGDTVVDVYLDPTIVAKRIHLNATVLKTGGARFRETLAQY